MTFTRPKLTGPNGPMVLLCLDKTLSPGEEAGGRDAAIRKTEPMRTVRVTISLQAISNVMYTSIVCYILILISN